MLLYEFYYYTQDDKNKSNAPFRILLLWLFMNIMSNILISYSSMLHSQLDAGSEEDRAIKKDRKY